MSDQEHELLASQKEEVMRRVEAAGFVRSEFQWEAAEGQFTGYSNIEVPSLTHRTERIRCAFARVSSSKLRGSRMVRVRKGDFWLHFSPGRESAEDTVEGVTWNDALDAIDRWLSYAVREFRPIEKGAAVTVSALATPSVRLFAPRASGTDTSSQRDSRQPLPSADKLTWAFVRRHVPLSWAAWPLGLLASAFSVGVLASRIPWVRIIYGLPSLEVPSAVPRSRTVVFSVPNTPRLTQWVSDSFSIAVYLVPANGRVVLQDGTRLDSLSLTPFGQDVHGWAASMAVDSIVAHGTVIDASRSDSVFVSIYFKTGLFLDSDGKVQGELQKQDRIFLGRAHFSVPLTDGTRYWYLPTSTELWVQVAK